MAFSMRATPSFVGHVTEALRRRKDVLRSPHPTHSVCACGEGAPDIVSAHAEHDHPFAWEGPWGAALRRGARYVFLGAERNAFSFFHAVEDFFGLPYLETVTALVDDRAKTREVSIRGWPSGPRSFYRDNSAAILAAMEAETGLKWREREIPAGWIRAASLPEVFEAARRAIAQRPDALLAPPGEGCAFSDAGRSAMRRETWRKRFRQLLEERTL